MTEVAAATRPIGQGRRNWFGIGFLPSTLCGVLPGFIRRMRSEHPDVEVDLQQMTTVQQRDALKTGDIDIGLDQFPLNDPAIACETIVHEPLVVAMPTSHRVGKRRAVRLADLAEEPLLLQRAIG